jgi:hypothetical protein
MHLKEGVSMAKNQDGQLMFGKSLIANFTKI